MVVSGVVSSEQPLGKIRRCGWGEKLALVWELFVFLFCNQLPSVLCTCEYVALCWMKWQWFPKLSLPSPDLASQCFLALLLTSYSSARMILTDPSLPTAHAEFLLSAALEMAWLVAALL